MRNLKKHCEARRAELIVLFNQPNQKKEHQQQLFGAIKELDYLIQLTNKLQNEESAQALTLKNDERPQFLARWKGLFK